MVDVETLEPFGSLGVAVAVGLLIGLERERTRPKPGESGAFFGGIRTFPLFSLLGGLSTLLSPALGPWPFVLATAGMLALMISSYRKDLEVGHHGMTSEGAFAIAFLLGALSTASGTIEPFSRRALTVSAVAVVVTLLLSAKVPLHQLTQRLSRDDVIAVLKLLIVGVVVLPVLPDKGYGPWGALNPQSVGKMVALIAGVGFAGWAATRVFGPGRGMLFTGAIGGLVSSTAVTLAAAARAKEQPALGPVSALAAVLASTLMVLRVGAVCAAVSPPLLSKLAAPIIAMAVGGGLYTALLYRHARAAERTQGLEVANPFELSTALKFAGLYAAVLVASRAGTEWFGSKGAYATALIAGTTDVDAITLSMSALARDGGLPLEVAALAVVLASVSNTLVKAGLALAVGGFAWGRKVALGLGAMLACGLAAAFFTVR